MNKMMKRLVKLVVFSLILSNFYIMPISADVNYDEMLRSQGCTEDSIEVLTQQEKEMLVNENFEYNGTDEFYVTFNDGDTDDKLKGTIPSSDMAISVTKWCSKNSNGSLSEIYVTVNYAWQKITNVAFEDAWGVAWDNSNLRCKDNSFSGETKNYTGPGAYQFSDYYGNLAKSSPCSFGGYVDQRYNYKQEHIQKFYLVPTSSNLYSGSVQLHLTYAHSLMFNGVSISLPGTFGGSVSFSGSRDERAATSTISW